jgi:chromosome segregation ATPase
MAKVTSNDDTIEALRKHIEALQQENEQLKEQINTAKIGWDTYKTYSEQLEQQTAESNKIIETQRQEIEKLKATLADWKYNAKCDADHIAALTTDKDELVKALEKAREALEQTKGFIKGIGCYCNYEGEYASQCQPCFIVKQIDKALAEIDKAIGGKEDE